MPVLFFYVSTTLMNSRRVKKTNPFCSFSFSNILNKALTYSSQKERTTYDCHLLECIIYT